MADFGKPDQTGRSSGILTRSDKKLIGPPQDESWIWLGRELVQADSWRLMSRYCFRFVNFLLNEHMGHAGRENGRLHATYAQLVCFGIPRRKIKATIDEAMERGLVALERHGGLYGVDNCRTPSLFRLTWIGCFNPARHATNEWRHYKRKIVSPVPRGGTSPVPPVWYRKTQKEAANG